VGAAEALGGSIRDRPKYSLGVLVQLVVPEAQNGPAFLLKKCISKAVPARFGMLAAVEFKNQLCLPAGEVGKVRANGELASELRT